MTEQKTLTATFIADTPEDVAQRSREIAGAVAEVDPLQIAVFHRLTPEQRYQQAVSMIELAEQVAVFRLRQRHPELSEIEALRTVRIRANDH